MKNLNFFVFVFCALICTSAIAQTLPAYLPANGLVAWYPFNGNANDESSNNFHGQVVGATSSSDRNGATNSAYYFNGLSNYIELPLNAGSLGGSSQFTISYWINREQTSNDWQTVFSYWITQGAGGFPYGFYTNVGNDKPYQSFIGGYNIGNFFLLNLGSWTQITVKYDGSQLAPENRVAVFVNGTLTTLDFNCNACSSNIPQTIPENVATANSIGARLINSSYDEFFKGKIDDIAIYNRALTQEEITALYTGTPVNNNNGGNTTANAVPPGIPYQAVVRNANGQVAANTAATTKFTLHQNTTNGAVEYQETHALTTNAQGLVSAVIGQGTAVQGTFAGINWSNTTKFLQVEVDLGNGYVDLGTQQLMSVPFALYAANGPVGPQGPAGADGAAGATGATGPQGPAGNDGQDGSSISSVVIQNNHLMVTLSNGTVMDAGAVLNEGCTNSAACNYSSSALYDNGSCLIVGQTCDDGDSGTYNDTINGECQCVGIILSIGQNFQGGKLAYIFQPGDAGYVQGETHGLIAAAQDLPGVYNCGCYGTNIIGADGQVIGTGEQNTLDIVNAGCGGAAQACFDLILNGYSDWFLPSIYELNQLYNNRDYINGFQNATYWSSTENGDIQVLWLSFGNGLIWGGAKYYDNFYVRAVRAF